MDQVSIAADLAVILPELTLVVLAMAGLMWGVYGSRDRLAPTLLRLAAAVMVAVALWLAFGRDGTATAFGGAFVDDAFARFAKVVILLSAAAVLLMSGAWLGRQRLMRFELPILAAFATAGMMVMASAADLMTLYMGLELQSLSLYVVAAFNRDSLRSTEAGLKYFVLGALSSGLLLYGASLTYGFAGSTLFEDIAAALGAGEHTPLGILFGLVFMASGLAFKVSAVPFHMWTPDVYEGSPTPVTAFFATAPKAAALALIARVLYGAFGEVSGDWQQILVFLSFTSMFLGAIAGIGQRDIKRLMA
ncbi:MAG: NADH-quinone oxidoreductase subunit N, partial [Alphaproteobacteria bacterium]